MPQNPLYARHFFNFPEHCSPSRESSFGKPQFGGSSEEPSGVVATEFVLQPVDSGYASVNLW